MGKTFLQRICISILIILTSFTTSTEAVAGGELANFGEFPHSVQLSISKTGQFFCGGSILAENVILTAAHCLRTEHPYLPFIINTPSNVILVTAGSLELRGKPNGNDREGEDWQRRELSHYILHPDYDTQQVTNDIALLFLKKPFTFSRTVQPIQLPSNQTFLRGTFSGWGRPDAWTKVSDRLKKLNIVFEETGSCNDEFSWAATVYHFTDKHICSKFPRGVGICKGDSGSSLVCEEERFIPRRTCPQEKFFPVICGVASWGNTDGNCGLSKLVAAFTNVYKYLDWIYETTEKNGFLIKKANLGSSNSSKEGFPYCGTGHQSIPNFHWFISVVIAIGVHCLNL